MPTPPSVPKRPFSIARHGDVREDPYYWLMDRDDEFVLAHLRAENEFLSESFRELKPLEDELFEEIKSPHRRDRHLGAGAQRGLVVLRTDPRRAQLSAQLSRAAAGEDLTPPEIDPLTSLAGEQVILDENAEAGDSDYFSVGVLAVSPDDDWVCVGTDFEGDELHHVTVRRSGGSARPWTTNSTTSTTASPGPWTVATSSTPASTRPSVPSSSGATNSAPTRAPTNSSTKRTTRSSTLSVGRSRDDAVIVVQLGSSMTTEVHYLAADDPTGELRLLEARRHGIEYGVEHFVDELGVAWWLKVTNEGATDFRLLAASGRRRRVARGDPRTPRVAPRRRRRV